VSIDIAASTTDKSILIPGLVDCVWVEKWSTTLDVLLGKKLKP